MDTQSHRVVKHGNPDTTGMLSPSVEHLKKRRQWVQRALAATVILAVSGSAATLALVNVDGPTKKAESAGLGSYPKTTTAEAPPTPVVPVAPDKNESQHQALLVKKAAERAAAKKRHQAAAKVAKTAVAATATPSVPQAPVPAPAHNPSSHKAKRATHHSHGPTGGTGYGDSLGGTSDTGGAIPHGEVVNPATGGVFPAPAPPGQSNMSQDSGTQAFCHRPNISC